MKRIRVIPVLLMRHGALVKTRRFRNPSYVGDPINAVRIFNDKGADELALLDISATPRGRLLEERVLAEIASEAFMPMAYGGGIASMEQAERVLRLGFEKIVLNTAAVERPELISELATRFGSSTVVVAIDARRNLFGRYVAFSHGGQRRTSLDPAAHARRMQEAGAGEILVTGIDRDGTFRGYDLDLLRSVSRATSIPVIASGGARCVSDFVAAIRDGGASAVAAGALFVFQGPHRAVLINYPSEETLRTEFFSAVGTNDTN